MNLSLKLSLVRVRQPPANSFKQETRNWAGWMVSALGPCRQLKQMALVRQISHASDDSQSMYSNISSVYLRDIESDQAEGIL